MIVVVSYGRYPRSIGRVFIDLHSVQQLTKAFKYPPRIARVFINFIVFTSWQRLLSVHDSARSK